MKKCLQVIPLLSFFFWGHSYAITEGLIGHWPLTPKEPLRVEWHAENADAGTWRTHYDWNSGNANISTVTLPGGDEVWEFIGYDWVYSSALIPVDPGKTYRLTGRFRSTGTNDSKLYFGYTPHDKDGNYARKDLYTYGEPATIGSWNDTTITATSTISGWSSSSSWGQRLLGIYYDGDTSDHVPDYVMANSSFGATYGAYNSVSDSTINLSAGLPSAVQTNIVPGTSIVKNHAWGCQAHLFSAAANTSVPTSWTTYSGTSKGDGWTQMGCSNFRPWTRYVRINLILNYNQDANSTIQFDDIVLEEVQGSEGSTDGSFFARDETPIRTLATDDRHHGEVYGGTFTTGINGEPRGAMHFDGTDYITLPNDIGYSDQVSAFSWFKQDGPPPSGYHIVLGKRELEISIHSSGYLRTGVTTDIRYVSNHGTGLTDGSWHHVGFTFDGSTKRAYIDGTEVGALAVPTGTLVSSFSDRTIGHFPSETHYLNGSLADARIYDRALSANEVAELAGSSSSFVGTSKISSINSTTSADAGRLYYNFETKKFWIGQSDGTVTQAASPPTHKTSAQISSLDGTALDGYYYYDTESRRFYVGQPNGSLRTLTD